MQISDKPMVLVVISTLRPESEAKANAYLKSGWVLKQLEPMSAAAGANSPPHAFILAVFYWTHGGVPVYPSSADAP